MKDSTASRNASSVIRSMAPGGAGVEGLCGVGEWVGGSCGVVEWDSGYGCGQLDNKGLQGGAGQSRIPCSATLWCQDVATNASPPLTNVQADVLERLDGLHLLHSRRHCSCSRTTCRAQRARLCLAAGRCTTGAGAACLAAVLAACPLAALLARKGAGEAEGHQRGLLGGARDRTCRGSWHGVDDAPV